MTKKIRGLLTSAAVSAVLVGTLAPVPAAATHACDPELSVLCAHPEDVLDLACDKSVLIDKIIERFQPCGTN